METNNIYQLTELFRQNIDWLNQILKGEANDTIIVDGVEKPSISKDIADHWSGIAAIVQGRKAYETKWQMDNAGQPPADQPLAEVWNDAVPGNNGLYGWSGGAWVKSKYDSIMAIADAMAAAEGFLDGEISRWDYTGSDSIKFWLDNPVYFRVKGTNNHRLPFPLSFELARTELAYVDDDMRDPDTNELVLQIVSHSDWMSIPASYKRQVVASNAYGGVWTSQLPVSPVEEAMKDTIEAGILIKDIEFSSGKVTFTFGDGKTDDTFEVFKGAQGTLYSITPFTTGGSYTLPQGYGLFFDFGSVSSADAITIEETPGVMHSSLNGHRSFIRGTKVLLIAGKTRNGIPAFYGKLAQQAFATWNTKQALSPVRAQALTHNLPLTTAIATRKLTGHDVEFTIPAFCYASFPSNPLSPEAGQIVLRTDSEFKIVAHENEVVFFDRREQTQDGRLIPQQMLFNDYAAAVSDWPYRRVIGWTRSSGWHGVNSTGTSPNLAEKISLSHELVVQDAFKAVSRVNNQAVSLFVQPTPGSIWQVYTGNYGMVSVEWSEEIKAELATYGSIELAAQQGIVCDLHNRNASNRPVAYKVANFETGNSLGRDDGGYLLLGYKLLNSRDAFFGQLKGKIEPYFIQNVRPYYAQMDRVAFVQDGSIPSYDQVTRTLTWPDEILILSPWRDETGYLRGRVRLKPGSVTIPSDNYYVLWIDKADIRKDDDALGVDSSKIRIARYYEEGGWQGNANSLVLGYCSYGNFTRVAFPPTRGTQEYPHQEGNTDIKPDVIVDVNEKVNDRHQIFIHIRDAGSAKGNFVRWVFERISNPDRHSDVWHIQRAYVVSPDLSNIVKEVITSGENETAIREVGKDDFVGGTAHGDEQSLWVNMQVDGTVIDLTVPGRYKGKVFRVQQHSQLYEENTQATVEWFKAWKSWEFSRDGVEVTQRLEFQRDADIDSFYNCFLCIARNQGSEGIATTAQFGAVDPYYEQEDLRPEDRPVIHYPSPRKAIAWGNGVSYSAEFLEGYEHQDPEKTEFNSANNRMFFQKGSNYNKMYFRQGYSRILTGAKTFTRYRYQISADL